LVDRLALVEVVADIQRYSPSQGPVAGNNRNMPWGLNLSKEQFELVWESYEQKMISKGLSNWTVTCGRKNHLRRNVKR
jgi:hypothetical protein